MSLLGYLNAGAAVLVALGWIYCRHLRAQIQRVEPSWEQPWWHNPACLFFFSLNAIFAYADYAGLTLG